MGSRKTKFPRPVVPHLLNMGPVPKSINMSVYLVNMSAQYDGILHCECLPNGEGFCRTLPVYLPNQGLLAHKLTAILVVEFVLCNGPNSGGFRVLGAVE
jgi:hypothetical protein